MCSFIYGCALSEPILGDYFELPKKVPPNRDLIYDKNHRKITDVIILLLDIYKKVSSFVSFPLLGIRLSIYGHRKIFRERDAHFQRFG